MRAASIIVAAGEGKRIKSVHPKQFVPLAGKPILAHTLEKFENCDLIEEIILVVSAMYLDYCRQEVVEKFDFTKIRKMVIGGEERQDSVYAGLKSLSPVNTQIVVIHDGVRPFVSVDKIKEAVKLCEKEKAVILAVPAKDTVKRVEDNLVITTLDREKLWLVQTPQVFEYKLIMEAYEKGFVDGFVATDDAMFVERLGQKVRVLEGDFVNFKITTEEDLTLAQEIKKLII
jgi:2-C-methyl-D-erythritol 4-phosphate cytidylyltransferase